jgi:hypothetical protein
MAMAVFDSVTVSMAALTSGILSVIRSVKRVETSMSRGKTADSAGIRRTSSKVKPTGKTSCSNTFHLQSRLKKNPDQGLGFVERSHFNANMKSYNKKRLR